MLLYHHIHKAVFLERPNRFIAHCLLNGAKIICHVKNTGRCKELLVSGCFVWVEETDNPARKTKYDLVCVESNGYIVNIDSQAPNKVFAEWASSGSFLPGLYDLHSEVKYKKSRFDFSWTCQGIMGFTEVKGVTLFDQNNFAYFPDAPTQRGIKHIHELIEAQEEGYHSSLCFVIQRENIHGVSPNDLTHPAFGQALRDAHIHGVQIIGVICQATPNSLTITERIPVII